MIGRFGDELPKELDKPVSVALQAIGLSRGHLEKSDGIYGLVRSVCVEPKQSVVI